MKRYYSFNQYLAETFGAGVKVYKIPIDAGFTCPNRDGTKGTGGCIYCLNRSFSPNTRLGERLTVKEQIRRGMDFYRRYQADKFIVYFQAYSNTYAPVERLKQLYDEAVSFKEVVGLAIGTRPDCLSPACHPPEAGSAGGDEILDLITDYARRYVVWLEYGIQSIHEKTLKLINRGHTYQDFVEAVNRTKGRPIKIATHIILGLPGETQADMIATAQALGRLGLDGIKIHHLYVAKDTPLADWYKEGKVRVMSLEEYIPLVCDVLENLPERMVIHRLVGELNDESVIAPRWGKPKGAIIAAIDRELAERGSYQGRKFPKCGACVIK